MQLGSSESRLNISYLSISTTKKIKLKVTNSYSEKINSEIEKYQEEIGKLSILHANGKIGEQSFLAALGALERKLAKLEEIKRNPNLSETFKNNNDLSPNCSTATDEFEVLTNQLGKPTALWYLAPFFFGLIGGLLGYVGTKNEDSGMANSLLIFGIIWSIILAVIYWVFLSSIF